MNTFVTLTCFPAQTHTVAALSCAERSFKCLMESRGMRGIFCLRLHSVSFPPGRAPVLTAAFWPTMLLHWDRIQSPIRDFSAPLKLCGILTNFCSAGFCSQTWPNYKVPLVHLCFIFPPWPSYSQPQCQSSMQVVWPPPTSLCHGQSLSSPGCPSMALSLPLGDNAFFPCHKADAVL